VALATINSGEMAQHDLAPRLFYGLISRRRWSERSPIPLCDRRKTLRVSVIMPTYNVENFISDSIQSVLDQTYQDWELVISDDGSTDGTLALLERFQESDTRIKLLRPHRNSGPAHARNLAIAAAQGRYIAFLDSDDLWKPMKLARQLAFMEGRDIAFSFSSYDRIDEDGNYINTHWVQTPVTYRDLLKTCVIGCLTAVYDTEKIGKVYMPDIRKRQDLGLWLRILKMTGQAVPLSESLALYRLRKNSVSADKISAAKHTWSIYRDVERLGLMQSAYYFANYAVNGVVNTYVRPRLRAKN
jgi:teichuronic acid biosynthesis glycosyltransferase TuaG